MCTPPRSAYDKTNGMAYFPRMIDKIRLHAEDRLRPDFHPNLGIGADGWCVGFLRIRYSELKIRVLEGGTDEEILEWCFTKGRRLNDTDLLIWNHFVEKLGWHDMATPRLQKLKTVDGLDGRDDIQTMAEYFEVDEGRKA